MNTRRYNDWKSMLLRNNPPPEIRRHLLEDDEYGDERKKSNKENLQNAKKNKNDEFYTQLSTVENELVHYRQHFENKVVFCNCDDYRKSQFFLYFARNFNHLKLKKLITTSFNEGGAKRIIIDELNDYNNDGRIDDGDINIKLEQEGVVKDLGSNGDFRTPQSEALLKQADIVVTNPPFSLFREFIAQLQEHNKKFLILGNNNAIAYKTIFPSIVDNKLWLGVQSNKTEKFQVPEEYKNHEKTIAGDDGNYYAKVSAISWFTNLEHEKRNESLIKFLHKKYDPNIHPTYDNFNAIEVNPLSSMPNDFAGLMGVPITYLTKHNPEEFEIIGSNASLDVKTNAFYVNDVKIYARLIIRNKHPLAPAHMLPERDVSGWIHPKKREKLQQQQQNTQPQYDQDFMNKLTQLLVVKPRKRKQDYVWKIKHPDNGTIVPIVYGPDPEQGGQMTIWHEGDDSFEPHFDDIYNDLVSQELVNG